jgi:rfaE bifunctional protein kinase chain/domain
VLVLGDVILDEYIVGRAERLSREAPVPVLEFQERRYIPGGAANPASNIVALGSEAIQTGIVGEDDTAVHLREELQARGIATDALITCPDKPTTLKTRILARMGLRFPQQVARVDTLSRHPIDDTVQTQVLQQIATHLPQVGALLVSDYHNGLLVPDLVIAVRDKAQSQGILTVADAQGKLQKYRGFDVVKCNADDARIYLRREITTDTEFATAAQALLEMLSLKDAMVITRGADGATIATADNQTQHCPAPAVSDVFDTVGAGDTAIAVMTLARIAGATCEDAVMLANYASGIVVRHVGNYTPSPAELRRALNEGTTNDSSEIIT